VSGWRDSILDEFVPQVCKLTLVADPDGLLTEEHMAVALRERGFDLIEFNDAIAFRCAYESKYRALWNRGEHTDLVVILRLRDTELGSLPYDLLNAGRQLSFNLGEIFPELSYPVIQGLDAQYLDDVFIAQQKTKLTRLGDNATRDFLLLHVFGIVPELVHTPVDLLKALIRLHYTNTNLPASLQQRIVEVLQHRAAFKAWALADILAEPGTFYQFLQERWPVYLARQAVKREIKEFPPVEGFVVSGPDYLPFDHPDIRVYIDNLFVERKLSKVVFDDTISSGDGWMLSGISRDASADADRRSVRLIENISAFVDEIQQRNLSEAGQQQNNLQQSQDQAYLTELRFTDWLEQSMKWAELSALIHSLGNHAHKALYDSLGTQLNSLFSAWLFRHYPGLINLPPSTPAMLHHVPRSMARSLESGQDKVALLVMDGLALDQWVTLRDCIRDEIEGGVLSESATFAWVPTLTSLSRQAIFAGNPPMYFPASINGTHAEEKLWNLFWENHGLPKSKVAYMKGLGDGNPAEALERELDLSALKVVGLVVDKVDRIMHGMELGAAGMHNQVKQWAETGYLSALINLLLDHGFEIWLTADHGNIESVGKGRPREGVIAETRGERVRTYPTAELRNQVHQEFDFAWEWPSSGLPKDYYPLVTIGKDAFISEGQIVVGHGGVSLEEVIVPLVTIKRRTN